MKKNEKQTIARFRVTFTKLITALFFVVIALCLVGVGVSVWRIIQYGINGFTDVVKYPFLIGICLFGIVLVICIMAKSEYVVDDAYLWLNYGFIKSRFAIKEITSIVQDTQLHKLNVYFGAEEFIAVNVKAEWFETFVRALLKVNPTIDYGFTLSDTPEENETK